MTETPQQSSQQSVPQPASPPAPPSNQQAPRVRPAQPADAAAIAQVHIRSREATMPYLPPRKRTDAEVEAWVRDIVLPGSAVWVAELDGRVVGYAAVEDDELDALYLLADVRRRGIGSLLLAAAKAHRPDGLGLFVFQKNTDARAFYLRHGFRVTAATDGSGNMEREPDLAMRWSPVTNGTRTVG